MQRSLMMFGPVFVSLGVDMTSTNSFVQQCAERRAFFYGITIYRTVQLGSSEGEL